MSHLLDRLNFFQSKELDQFSNGHGQTTRENRDWEDTYRNRWRHDKIVRSTHGVNCTGSCSWKIYVKSGIVTWETQQTDYPRTRPDLPNHEPRGCARGASYSWYLYSANRVKNPLIRGRLMKAWRRLRENLSATAAWKALQEDPILRATYVKTRGKGGFVRANWDEATEIIAAANAYTAKTYGPDRVFGFSPIPAMSMVSYAAGSRYLSLLGGVCMSFYDWYCDLPPASPMTWGEQTDVPESADWYNSGFLLLWGSNVPQTRTPDAHFYTEARYRGTKSAVVCPDYSEAAKFGDIWLAPKQGTDSALAMAMGHVILRELIISKTIAANTATSQCLSVSKKKTANLFQAVSCVRMIYVENLVKRTILNGRLWHGILKPRAYVRQTVRLAIAGVKTANGTWKNAPKRPIPSC